MFTLSLVQLLSSFGDSAIISHPMGEILSPNTYLLRSWYGTIGGYLFFEEIVMTARFALMLQSRRLIDACLCAMMLEPPVESGAGADRGDTPRHTGDTFA